MSLGDKYKSSDCGCSNSSSTKTYKNKSCCSTPVQQSPVPCCESHDTVYQAGVCLKPTCNMVASSDGFTLKFSNISETLPVGGNILLYHESAGAMRIVGVDDFGSYQLALEDSSKAGALIQKGDCILIGFKQSSELVSTSRCLTGIFNAPAVNASETIYIENGTSIPVGSTLTFTYNGSTGSYNVTSFVSASGTTYAYEVTNTGNGLTPGTMVNGGVTGSCTVPIELITDVDICDLSEANSADALTGCLNGSPRAVKPVGLNDILVGTSTGTWTLGKLSSVDCCVVIDDCLKFSGNNCPDGTDVVVLRNVNIDCFTEAFAEVTAANVTGSGQTGMPMNIDGFNVIATAYNSATRALTLQAVDDVPANGLSYAAGTQICLGECCRTCIGGPKFTNPMSSGNGDPLKSAFYGFATTGQLVWEQGVKHRYLIGFNNTLPLAVTVLELPSTYSNNAGNGPGKPLISDPLLFRNKICNNSDKGCDQFAEIQWNYEMIFDPVPAGVRIHWELGHYAQGAATLEDNVTVNPFFSLSTQQAAAGYIEGPSSLGAQATLNSTSIGFGGPGSAKVFPYVAGDFRDYLYLERCNCGLSIVWFYVEVEVVDPALVGNGLINSDLAIRQQIKFFDANEIAIPSNNPAQEGFNS